MRVKRCLKVVTFSMILPLFLPALSGSCAKAEEEKTGFQAVLKKRKGNTEQEESIFSTKKESKKQPSRSSEQKKETTAKKKKKKYNKESHAESTPAKKAVEEEAQAAPPAPSSSHANLSQVEAPAREPSSAEEKSLTTKVSGFASVEYERSKRFGYNGSSGVRNFSAEEPYSLNDNINFLSNIQFDIAKDNTNLTTVLEIGEVYFGDSTSGGAVGAKGKILELRNMYITHNIYDWLSIDAGLVPVVSDPRGFVVNDNYGALRLNYQTKITDGYVWYARSSKDLPSSKSINPDTLYGVSSSFSLPKNMKTTLYALQRTVTETLQSYDTTNTTARSTNSVKGKSKYRWAGVTFDYTGIESLGVELSYIHNWSKFAGRYRDTSDGVVDLSSDHYQSHMIDAKLMYTLEKPNMEFSVEGIRTTGSSEGSTSDGSIVINKRKHFNAPFGLAYLLTIANSDFADDAPGSPKESVIATLSQPEGLSIITGKISGTIRKGLTAYARYGIIDTVKAYGPGYPTPESRGKRIGTEWDLGAAYELSGSTSLHLDYARFNPGDYYNTPVARSDGFMSYNRHSASLFATKMKYTF